MSSRIIEAIKATPSDYLTRCIAQRCGIGAQGSRYEQTPDEVRYSLEHAQWMERDHPSVKAPCAAFVAPRWLGTVGVVPLDGLNAIVRLDDVKGTGRVSAVVDASPDFPRALVEDQPTWLILGPDEDGREIVYTFHPGEPIAPSEVDARVHKPGTLMLASDALALGLTHAKLGNLGYVIDGDESGSLIDYAGEIDGHSVTLRLSSSGGRIRWYASYGATFIADYGGGAGIQSSPRLALMDAYTAARVALRKSR